MPVFVYYKTRTKLGYAAAVHYTPTVHMTGENRSDNVFQTHKITDDEARRGLDYLTRTYKVRVRVKAHGCRCSYQNCTNCYYTIPRVKHV